MFGCCLVEACSFLKGSEGGVDEGMGDLGGMVGGKTVVKIYCMREYPFTIEEGINTLYLRMYMYVHIHMHCIYACSNH